MDQANKNIYLYSACSTRVYTYSKSIFLCSYRLQIKLNETIIAFWVYIALRVYITHAVVGNKIITFEKFVKMVVNKKGKQNRSFFDVIHSTDPMSKNNEKLLCTYVQYEISLSSVG